MGHYGFNKLRDLAGEQVPFTSGKRGTLSCFSPLDEGLRLRPSFDLSGVRSAVAKKERDWGQAEYYGLTIQAKFLFPNKFMAKKNSCAILSVSDKTGIVPLARILADAGVCLISTGGTAGALRSAGLEVVEVSDYTGFPEMLDGLEKSPQHKEKVKLENAYI